MKTQMGHKVMSVAKSRKSCCTTPGVGFGIGIGFSKMLKFYVKVFYVMGKALSGELSCPCDRSCLSCLFTFKYTELKV